MKWFYAEDVNMILNVDPDVIKGIETSIEIFDRKIILLWEKTELNLH